MMSPSRQAVVIASLLLVSLNLLATTWVSVPQTCPVCGTKCELGAPGSSGSYIYQAESRFQLLFWPETESRYVWLCHKCHFATLMFDFEPIAEPKLSKVKAYLANVEVPKVKMKVVAEGKKITQSTSASEYWESSTVQRLKIARGMYEILGRDDEFWAFFFRVLAYHAEIEGQAEEARVARVRAQEFVGKLLADPSKREYRKQLLLTAGSLALALGEPARARTFLEESTTTPFHGSAEDPADNKAAEEYYIDLAKELLARAAPN